MSPLYLWVIIRIGASVISTIGPVPYSYDECEKRAAALIISNAAAPPLMMTASCEYAPERPQINGTTITLPAYKER